MTRTLRKDDTFSLHVWYFSPQPYDNTSIVGLWVSHMIFHHELEFPVFLETRSYPLCIQGEITQPQWPQIKQLLTTYLAGFLADFELLGKD